MAAPRCDKTLYHFETRVGAALAPPRWGSLWRLPWLAGIISGGGPFLKATPMTDVSGHKDRIMSAAISPDGRWLVTGSWDNTARLWDLTAEDPAGSSIVLRGHAASIMCVAISADGRWVVTASVDHTARLWDLTAADPARASIVLRGHGRTVISAAISPDSRWVATGSWDKTARLWDLTAADPAASAVVLWGHDGRVSSLAISPDSRWLATGSADKTVRLWRLQLDDVIEFARRRAGRTLSPEERQRYSLAIEPPPLTPAMPPNQ